MNIDNAKQKTLIFFELTFLTILVLSDWTMFFICIRPVVFYNYDQPWLGIIVYIPLIWMIQLHSLRIERHYIPGLIYYPFLFVSNGYHLFIVVFENASKGKCTCSTLEQIISRAIIEFIIGVIIFLIIKNRN